MCLLPKQGLEERWLVRRPVSRWGPSSGSEEGELNGE